MVVVACSAKVTLSRFRALSAVGWCPRGACRNVELAAVVAQVVVVYPILEAGPVDAKPDS